MTDPRIQKMIDLAKSQVGYHEGFSHGHHNNITKYAPDVPALRWAQGQPWCAVFVYWLAMKCDLGTYFPETASVPAAAKWFKTRRQWSEYPAIGAQAIFGNYAHTGFVVDYDDTYVWTVEGNSNNSGSPEGDGVYLKKHRRRDNWVLGYGYPNLPLQSADPSYPLDVEPAHTLGIDYSFARPAPATIKAAGYSAVGRYLSNYPKKNLTKPEQRALHREGLGIWVVLENGAERAGEGRVAGVTDAHDAFSQASALGFPEICPIYFAVDYDATFKAVAPYLSGFQSVLGHRTGVYGSYKITVAARAAGIEYTWQTVAWSHGLVDTSANLLQRIRATVKHPIKATDENVIQRPFELWLP